MLPLEVQEEERGGGGGGGGGGGSSFTARIANGIINSILSHFLGNSPYLTVTHVLEMAVLASCIYTYTNVSHVIKRPVLYFYRSLKNNNIIEHLILDSIIF